MRVILLVGLVVGVVVGAIVHLPLDQRFATRVAFLNMGTLTPFEVISEPEYLLPSLKQNKDPDAIVDWFYGQAKNEQLGVVSMEMLLYGGLIASRISNDSEVEVKERIDKLQFLKNINPHIKLYASAVVMRIPAYDNDFEEPTYWATYGKLLYQYSFFKDKFSKTGNQRDFQRSQQYQRQIPAKIFTQFLNRRKRNQNILIELVKRLAKTRDKGSKLFERLYITLDDNAEYGLNIAEADQLKHLVTQLNLSDSVLIYPGADQVSLVLLSKAVADYYSTIPRIKVMYRNQNTTNLIPKYEGEPLLETINNQVRAAGGVIDEDGQIILLVNNFNGPYQIQAPDQANDQSTSYTKFDSYFNQKHKVLGFIDNKYSNGADINFVDYILQKATQYNRNISQWAFAGWNTNGNTVGTVIANAIIINTIITYPQRKVKEKRIQGRYCQYCSPCSRGDYLCGNAYFNVLRILEDRDWQAILRQKMISYIAEVPTDSYNQLDSDLPFYQKYALKSLQAKGNALFQQFDLNFKISEVYFPWNRTFEVGIVANFVTTHQEL